jgi:hypothetical protein
MALSASRMVPGATWWFLRTPPAARGAPRVVRWVQRRDAAGARGAARVARVRRA